MNVSRREIWLANLDPVLGREIRKTRPVVSDSILIPFLNKRFSLSKTGS